MSTKVSLTAAVPSVLGESATVVELEGAGVLAHGSDGVVGEPVRLTGGHLNTDLEIYPHLGSEVIEHLLADVAKVLDRPCGVESNRPSERSHARFGRLYVVLGNDLAGGRVVGRVSVPVDAALIVGFLLTNGELGSDEESGRRERARMRARRKTEVAAAHVVKADGDREPLALPGDGRRAALDGGHEHLLVTEAREVHVLGKVLPQHRGSDMAISPP